MSGRRQASPPPSPLGRWPAAVTCLLALFLAGALTTGPVADELDLALPWNPTRCTPVHVEIVTSTDVQPVVTQILENHQGSALPKNRCLHTYVRGQAPGNTVASVDQLPADRIPHLWIPDSSLWSDRAPRWTPRHVGTFATSPLVIASTRAAQSNLGWSREPPTWGQALTPDRAVLLPDLKNNTTGALSLLALWHSLGRNERADRAIAAAVLTSARSEAPTEKTLRDAARTDQKNSPLLPTTEMEVFTRHTTMPALVATYPEGGSPWLDYPLLRLSPRLRDQHETNAVDKVVETLTSQNARTILYAAGLRDAHRQSATTRTTGTGTGLPRATVRTLNLPDRERTREFLDHLTTLSRPSRILLAVDVSPSMRTPTSHGLNRADLAGQAVRQTGRLLPDRSSAGLWIFPGKPSHTSTELALVRPLSTPEHGQTHRDQLSRHLLSLNTHLSDTNTALNRTAVDAVRALHNAYSPEASNTVVILTDGPDKNTPHDLTLPQALTELDKLSRPDENVRLITIGLGDNPDMTHLQALSRATGARAYQAHDTQQVKQILFDALSRRDDS
ncbi:MAG: Ca-activated chloride channel [Actinomycetota bacterium]|nr:Ca-activated chloride channel [Actinomycetota bacterium]